MNVKRFVDSEIFLSYEQSILDDLVNNLKCDSKGQTMCISIGGHVTREVHFWASGSRVDPYFFGDPLGLML